MGGAVVAALRLVAQAVVGGLLEAWRERQRERAMEQLGYTAAQRDQARLEAAVWRGAPRDRESAVERLRAAARRSGVNDGGAG